jgi:DHA2 family multidrug resistance protein
VNLLLAARYIHDPPYLQRERGSVDWWGLGTMVVGLGAVQVMLEKGESKDWFQSRAIVALAVIGVVGLAAFIWRELRTPRPAVDLRLLEHPTLASATAIVGVLGMGLYGTLFLLPLFLQGLLGYTAMESGLALMPRSLAMAVCMPVVGRLYNRVGPRAMVSLGLAVSAFSFFELSHLTTQTGTLSILGPQLWQGVGFSLIFVPLSTAALADIPRPQITAAAGLYNVVRQVFGSVGVAMAATAISSGTTRAHALLSEHVTAYDPTTREWMMRVAGGMMADGSDPATARARALQLLDFAVTRQAAVIAYNRAFLLVALLFVVALPLVLALRRRPALSETVPEAMAAD